MKYDLKDIITFVYIANLRSFSKVADILKVSKTAITNRIKNLEDDLKMSLIARTTREVNLTSDGREFLEYCKPILEKVSNLDNFLDEYKGISGTLRVVLPPYFSRYHIVPYLGEFLAQYPDLKLDLTLTENPLNIIEEGHDLQIRIQIPEEENLEVVKLMTNHKIVCASPEYLAKNGTPKTPNDLLKHNCIIFGENKTWEFRKNGDKEVIKLSDMSGNVSCDNGEVVKELVLSGVGITLKSSRDVADEIKSGKLVVLLEVYEVVNETFFYAVFPAGIKSLKTKAFIEFFRKKLRK